MINHLQRSNNNFCKRHVLTYLPTGHKWETLRPSHIVNIKGFKQRRIHFTRFANWQILGYSTPVKTGTTEVSIANAFCFSYI